jgi:hypothetical protein
MKSFFALALFVFSTAPAIAATTDTLQVKPGDLDIKALQTGSYSYIIYTKQTKDSPAQRLTLVKINVEAKSYHNKPAFIVTQQWDRDTVYHSAYSVFDAKDFSTIVHYTWWKSLGYQMKFDFEKKTVGFTKNGMTGAIPDTIKTTATNDFNQSFNAYNLNWHADLLVYQLLPYKEGRTFMINYYDPGFGKAEKVAYYVTGSDILIDSRGQKIDCWVLNHTEAAGSETFWIAKKTKEVLKEEDVGKRGYRYKIKFGISGDI